MGAVVLSAAPAFRAGLDPPIAWVKVGPPLSWSGPRTGSWPLMLLPPTAPVEPLVSSISESVALKSPRTSSEEVVAELSATIEFFNWIGVSPVSRIPPAVSLAVLSATVVDSRLSVLPEAVEAVADIPAPSSAVLPETVEFEIVSPPFKTVNPPPLTVGLPAVAAAAAVLPEMVDDLIVRSLNPVATPYHHYPPNTYLGGP